MASIHIFYCCCCYLFGNKITINRTHKKNCFEKILPGNGFFVHSVCSLLQLKFQNHKQSNSNQQKKKKKNVTFFHASIVCMYIYYVFIEHAHTHTHSQSSSLGLPDQ